jgi:hypothetical protein
MKMELKQMCVMKCLQHLVIWDEPRPRGESVSGGIFVKAPHLSAVPRRGPEAGDPSQNCMA